MVQASPLPRTDEEEVEKPPVASLRDRVAARKKEGSFDEQHTERKAEGDMKKRLAERKKKAEEVSTARPESNVSLLSSFSNPSHAKLSCLCVFKGSEHHCHEEGESRGGETFARVRREKV